MVNLNYRTDELEPSQHHAAAMILSLAERFMENKMPTYFEQVYKVILLLSHTNRTWVVYGDCPELLVDWAMTSPIAKHRLDSRLPYKYKPGLSMKVHLSRAFDLLYPAERIAYNKLALHTINQRLGGLSAVYKSEKSAIHETSAYLSEEITKEQDAFFDRYYDSSDSGDDGGDDTNEDWFY